jgi:hypothetical protein
MRFTPVHVRFNKAISILFLQDSRFSIVRCMHPSNQIAYARNANIHTELFTKDDEEGFFLYFS